MPNWPKFGQLLAKNCDIFFCLEYFFFVVDFKGVFEKIVNFEKISQKKKNITPDIFFLSQMTSIMEGQKTSKTAKSDFTVFGTRREHEKIAKMQQYSM